jgi:hypothetical protein
MQIVEVDVLEVGKVAVAHGVWETGRMKGRGLGRL